MTIQKAVLNCETGEEIIVPLTADELAQRQLDIALALEGRKEPTVIEKLASVGLDVNDLKDALGL